MWPTTSTTTPSNPYRFSALTLGFFDVAYDGRLDARTPIGVSVP